MSTDSALHNLFSRRGAAALAWLGSWSRLLHFSAQTLIGALTPATYNSATRAVALKQIYFTAWQILPGFTLFATLLAYVLIEIVVTTAADFGLSLFAMEMSLRLLVLEILPLTTVLFVALRSGAAITTEVALMHINNELHALEDVGVDPMRFEFIPRVVGGTISVLSLAAVSSTLTLGLAYFIVYGPHPWGFEDFRHVVGEVFNLSASLALVVKLVLFGLAVTLIPIHAGLDTPRKLYFAPIAVFRGMVRLFFVVMFIEVAALALIYI
jgi:phospholipid/cholesterol/gamma-HCH transport system permease protein